ncbi:hypothetical protein P170DRAFT_432325 [Aspergillus steynii IBT 23096]|uniref:Uncharacterized protein n=1 Tax=Aspergillus steynii IBT 23096 TaxID=1392250 RepID=A0A2I2GP92_9EURO|nr:uncharacterized protein P170DRAFT_432325 [Aspergillus steynii IBT 23096]PLB54697.1 hypothetical protein P170DRAFT_432325 [Aspergillus steynii IBT 23096]
MFLTQSESYSHLPSSNTTTETPPLHDLVGAIYTDPKRPADAGVYIPTGDLKWTATQTPRGYRFQLKRTSASARPASASAGAGGDGITTSDAPPSRGQGQGQGGPESLDIALDWERRARTSSDETTDPSSSSSSKPDRFVLNVADQPHLRRPWLATLTKKGFMVGGWDRGQRAFLAERLAVDDQALYTCFLALGVYVARLEGWV